MPAALELLEPLRRRLLPQYPRYQSDDLVTVARPGHRLKRNASSLVHSG